MRSHAHFENMTKVMLVDDEEKALKVLCRSLNMLDYSTIGISDSQAAIDTIKKESPDVVIVDLIMPHLGGIELLDLIKKTTSNVPVIVLTGYGTVKTAVEAMRRGAFDYVTKPYDIDEIDLTIKRALEQRGLFLENQMLKEELLRQSPFSDIITHDTSMKRLLQEVQTLADTDSTVLITGESGTGKELIAKALHFSGSRRDKPFITVDCGALPETILESEVFGHVKGSFTGAYTDKKGYIEVAGAGSVFFDEIGELPFFLQKKLLRVAQEKEFFRVGDTKSRRADIRLITATNRDLKEEVKAGRFREDLFYRLNVISLHIPPLRTRPEDIPLLFNYFVAQFNARFKKRITKIGEDVYRRAAAYSWPGNVRELKNAVERIVALKQGNTITMDDLPDDMRCTESDAKERLPSFKDFKQEVVGNVTREYVLTLLAMFNGNVTKAAAKARIDRGNFRKLLKRLELSPTEYRKQ
ncbi:MAG: sigma-54 dependent transcriptional regulator [Syntrophorhabdales bacterium]|jgi:DNA-binding NtrC family response regulator